MIKKRESELDGKVKKVMVGRKVAAEMFDTSPGYLSNLLSKGRGPKAYKVWAKVLYRVSDLEEFFTANPIQTIDSFKVDSFKDQD